MTWSLSNRLLAWVKNSLWGLFSGGGCMLAVLGKSETESESKVLLKLPDLGGTVCPKYLVT